VAQPEVVVMLVIHDPGCVKGAEIDHFGVAIFVVGCVVAESQHGFAGVAIPAPVEVVLMAADGGGQAVYWAEDIHGAGFAVVAAEDGGAGAHVGRQSVVADGKAFNHLWPAEAVREYLRQRTGKLFLFDFVGAETSRISVVFLRRQNCQHHRRSGAKEQIAKHRRVDNRWPVAPGEFAEGYGSGGEKRRIDGRSVVILGVHGHHHG
jgi:hypothetical protein